MLEREKGQRSDCWLRVRERKNKIKEIVIKFGEKD